MFLYDAEPTYSGLHIGFQMIFNDIRIFTFYLCGIAVKVVKVH